MSQKAQKVLEPSEMDVLTMMKEDQQTAGEILFQGYLAIANQGGFGEMELLCNGDIVGDNYDSPVYFQFSRTEDKHLKDKNNLPTKKRNQSLWKIRFRDESGYLNEPAIVSQKKFENLLRQAMHNIAVIMRAVNGLDCDLKLIKMKYQ